MLRDLDNAIMPLRCVFCGTRTRPPERYLCAGCDDDLPRIPSPPPPLSSPFEHDIAPLAYAFPVDAAIKALKFKRQLWYGPALAQLACCHIGTLPRDIDAVLPVPLHWRRKWWRGFNQAREIARPVARRLGVPLLGGVRRVRATRPQPGLSQGERRRNMREAFVVRGRCRARHVLIVDDVITTGATIAQLARTVLDGGADRVSVLAVARAGY